MSFKKNTFSGQIMSSHICLPMGILKCAVLSIGMAVSMIFGDALQVNRLPMSKLLAEAKYRPINPPVDLMINPLIKPKHDTRDVDESLDSAYC